MSSPLRAELFSVSQLEHHARTLAGWHELAPVVRAPPDRLLARLAANEVELREAYSLIAAAVERGRQITPAAEWFVDNHHLIEEQIRTARRHLPRKYDRELPRLVSTQSSGAPRVYDIALELISHSHGRVDLENLRAFVAAYQAVQPLRLGELWAIPIMLRLALLENLRAVVAGVTAGRRDREWADRWVERMLEVTTHDPAKVVLILADMVREDPPLSNAFVAEFASRLQGQGSTLLFPMSWLEHRLTEKGQTVDHVFQLVSQSQAADQVAISNSIGSLRLLDATDWRDFTESMSVVEHALAADPLDLYPAMDFGTRDRYRHVVEALAKRSGRVEVDVARLAVELASASRREPSRPGGDDERAARTAHLGYFLIDRGRRSLERALGVRWSTRRWSGRVGERLRPWLYGGALAITTAVVTALVCLPTATVELGWAARVAAWALFALVASQLAVGLVHWGVTVLIRPELLPRLDFSAGIPPAHRTVVAVPAMLTDGDEIDDLLESMEVRFLANRDRNLGFALLSDLRDAPSEHLSSDQALVDRATAGVDALNRKYAGDGHGGFFLFHRPRRWNPSEGAWMGWERKRGKLEEFNAALRGAPGRFAVIVGPRERLQGVRYVIALDSDTQLPRDAARTLAATMAHPLNRPCFDPRLGRVTAGYAILQPRVGVTMASVARSRFAALFAGEPGIDPYSRAVSDVYQDLFGEGSFVGKGIYDLDAMRRALDGRLPDNRILSHDLLEGAYARAGLVSDVLLFEAYPTAYATDVSRRHRWMRGDWQLTPWLGRRVPAGPVGEGPARPSVARGARRRTANPISLLSQWKVLDNLRRSLIAGAALTLLLAGWAVPGTALYVTVVITALVAGPCLLAASAELIRRPRERPWRQHAGGVVGTLARQLLREAVALACLPHDAYLGLDALTRTAVRVVVTRRRLLEWRTASDAQRGVPTGVVASYAAMWIGPAIASATAVGLGLANPAALPAAAAMLGLWALAPGLTWWLSRPLARARPDVSADDRAFLGTIARRTWRFFEAFVGPADHHLPPDNVQEDPPRGVAHRTSPTNIGLSLTASLAAYDFGYLPVGELIARTSRTFATMDRLERHRGHFYNWYDTATLVPLRPLYVSTVDSGNLAGHLLTLASGLAELARHAIVRPESFAGLGDTLRVVGEVERARASGTAPSAADRAVQAEVGRLEARLGHVPRTLSGTHALLRELCTGALDLGRAIEPCRHAELSWWGEAFAGECQRARDELAWVAPWAELIDVERAAAHGVDLASLDQIPTLADTARLAITVPAAIELARVATASAGTTVGPVSGVGDARGWLEALRAAVVLGSERAALRLAELDGLAARGAELSDLDYEFLYDRDRHLLSIGYDVTDHRLDASFYDLLASEARLASFVAIAQGKLPQEHWFRLGRLLTKSGGRPALLSWSGSMFEYLMPLLVMPTYDGTVLDETNRAVVARQIEYGRERGVPWGISESGYNKTDAHLNYQYQAFGVPGLGFKRGLADDTVVAPYASAMALMVAPRAACANLRRLAADGRLGAFGFYEAIDYTAARLPPDKDSVTVRSYMAHHQGMSLLALAYLLRDRPMQRRWDASPAFRATDLLLQERVPRVSSTYPNPAEVSAVRDLSSETASDFRVFASPITASPEVHLLSNGRYHVAITNAGGGYSRWRDLAVTRWHEDPTRDAWGTFGYLRDLSSGAFWSIAHQPTLSRAARYEAIYSHGRAEFRRRDGEIDTHVEISVSPEDDIELRRVSLTNLGRSPRTIELTSFAEVVLAPAAADAAHPAFSNLFVQTEIVPARQAILCSRRPRSSGEHPPWMVHLMTVAGTPVGTTSYETGRAEFVGRGRSVADPIAMHAPALTNSEGAVLDPIVAIRTTVRIEPDETVRLQLFTGVAETRDAAVGLIEKYGERHAADRVFELSFTHSQVEQRRLDATDGEIQLYERLASNILYSNPALRAPRSVLARNRTGQSGLWAYGISGDLPIVLVRISDVARIELVRQLVKAHAYWRSKGLTTDLVIWNEDPSGYRQVLQEQIIALIGSFAEASILDRPGGVFVRRSEQMSEEDSILLQTVARVIISDSAGGLADQVDRRPRSEVPSARLVAPDRRSASLDAAEARRPGQPLDRPDLAAFNGTGGFTQDGREYVIITRRGSPTPAPWSNVLANPWFGTVVSESGSAYTWCENAHSYRLTPWHNDPVSDVSGEALYLRDEQDGQIWSPTALPAGDAQPYTSRHGFGYSVFEHTTADGLTTELRTFVATDAPVKFLLLKIRNRSGRRRRLSLTGYFELVLGSNRAANLPHVVTEVDPRTGALLARNGYNGEFAQRIAFLAASEEHLSVTGDRAEFLGRTRGTTSPAGLEQVRLSGRVGAGFDPCFAMQVPVDLADGQEREIAFTFGSGRDLDDTRNLLSRFRGVGPARKAIEGVWAHWNRIVGAVSVRTPDPALDFMANGWLLYQVLACRMWGRSGYYQSGGAFGFRDQLQDAMALVHAEPAVLREQIVRCASRQFLEGDVQHWWHPPQGRGVRTRISDDYLWLPYATCRYVAALGDTGVLDERVGFLEGRAVNPDEDSYYDLPARSDDAATIYDHCVRAIERGLRRGVHGLPLMGSGDWNDGMNLVGDRGAGESVWLAFFLHDVLVRFAELARARRDEPFALRCTAEAARLASSIEAHGWDGEWYRRAYFDSGEPLGSRTSAECQIDSLPQSWAALSRAGDPGRARQALAAVDARLVRRDLGVIQLFDPPFDVSEANPGYIKGYVPGVRENGGQYTHAAVWTAMAFAAVGDAARAWELFDLINPVHHGDSPAAIARYKVEPYVAAADVYVNRQHEGRGGWTWYTGSAGWMYRLITESLLGLHLEVDRLRFAPLMAPGWDGYDVRYRYRETTYHIHVRRVGRGQATTRVICDGAVQDGATIWLRDDRQDHRVEVEVGAA